MADQKFKKYGEAKKCGKKKYEERMVDQEFKNCGMERILKSLKNFRSLKILKSLKNLRSLKS